MTTPDLDLIRFVQTCDSMQRVLEEDLAEHARTQDPALAATLRTRAEHAAATGQRMLEELAVLGREIFGPDFDPQRVQSAEATAPKKVRAHDRRKTQPQRASGRVGPPVEKASRS